MKLVMKKLTRLALATALFSQSAVLCAEPVLIVHPDNALAELSKKDVSRIYLGKMRSSPAGGSIKPLDQSSGSDIRKEFYNDYLQMSEANVKRYWSRLMFSGKGRPPAEIRGDDAVKSAVISSKSAIGYIDSANADDSIKVIKIRP